MEKGDIPSCSTLSACMVATDATSRGVSPKENPSSINQMSITGDIETDRHFLPSSTKSLLNAKVTPEVRA